MKFTSICIIPLVLGFVSVSSAFAQDEGERATDRQIVRWLTTLNRSEIEISGMAAKQAETEQVKKYAEKMVREHAELTDQLLAVVRPQRPANRQVADEDSLDTVLQKAEDTFQTAFRVARRKIDEQVSPRGLPVLQAAQEIDQQLLDQTKKILEGRQGLEFDRAYLIQQASEHLRMLVTIDVLSEYASEDLQTVLRQAKQATQGHLEQSRELYNQLEQR